MNKDFNLSFSLSELTLLVSEITPESRDEIIKVLQTASHSCNSVAPDDYVDSHKITQLVVNKINKKVKYMQRRQQKQREIERQKKHQRQKPLRTHRRVVGFKTIAEAIKNELKLTLTISDVGPIMSIYRRRGALNNKILPTVRTLAKRSHSETLTAIGDAIEQLINFVDQIFPEITYLRAHPYFPRIIAIHLRPMHPIGSIRKRQRPPFRRRSHAQKEKSQPPSG